MTKNYSCGKNIDFSRNWTKSHILNCKTAFYYFLWISMHFNHSSRKQEKYTINTNWSLLTRYIQKHMRENFNLNVRHCQNCSYEWEYTQLGTTVAHNTAWNSHSFTEIIIMILVLSTTGQDVSVRVSRTSGILAGQSVMKAFCSNMG